MALNLCTQYSIRPEVTEIFGRISGTGAIVAPVSGPGFTVTHTANSGVYVVTLVQRFAEFLGVSGAVVSAAPATATANIVGPTFSWNPALAQLTITVLTQNITTPAIGAAADSAITEVDFDLAFADSRVP